MNYNPSPRSEVLKEPNAVKRHHDLVENQTLRDHLGFALSEMMRRAAQCDPSNFNQCAAAHLRMLGAQEFVDLFLNLAETNLPETRRDSGNLPLNTPAQPRKN